jgi:hypothetical protein
MGISWADILSLTVVGASASSAGGICWRSLLVTTTPARLRKTSDTTIPALVSRVSF